MKQILSVALLFIFINTYGQNSYNVLVTTSDIRVWNKKCTSNEPNSDVLYMNEKVRLVDNAITLMNSATGYTEKIFRIYRNNDNSRFYYINLVDCDIKRDTKELLEPSGQGISMQEIMDKRRKMALQMQQANGNAEAAYEERIKRENNEGSTANGASKREESGWNTFHHVYGFVIDLPVNIMVGAQTDQGIQKYTYLDKDYLIDNTYSISVASEDTGKEKTETFKNCYERDLKNCPGITYKRFAATWYVITGTSNGKVYYKKTIISKRINTLNISYNLQDTSKYNQEVSKISKSFEAE